MTHLHLVEIEFLVQHLGLGFRKCIAVNLLGDTLLVAHSACRESCHSLIAIQVSTPNLNKHMRKVRPNSGSPCGKVNAKGAQGQCKGDLCCCWSARHKRCGHHVMTHSDARTSLGLGVSVTVTLCMMAPQMPAPPGTSCQTPAPPAPTPSTSAPQHLPQGHNPCQNLTTCPSSSSSL